VQGFLTEGLRKTSAGLGSVSSLCCVTINVKCIGRERERERKRERLDVCVCERESNGSSAGVK
jgi:hypothetical protein